MVTARWWRAAALTLALVVAAAAAPASAGVQKAGEYELKAAFLFNFAKFVEWPDEAGGAPATPVCIGVVDPDPFGATLERALAGKTLHARPIALRRFASAAAVRDCHVVFVSAAAEGLAGDEGWDRPGVLTVGETRTFLGRGGVIAFAMEGDKLRFAVDAGAADRAGLKLSSQLLKLATHVAKGTDE